MQAMGVDMLRISPVENGTADIIERFKSVGQDEQNRIPLSDEFCNGYWYAKPGMDSVASQDGA